MHAMIRFLSGQIHPVEIAFFRNLFGLAILAPMLMRGMHHLRTRRLRLHFLRAVLQLGSMLAFFTALGLAPLARVSAMSFTAPLFATLGAVLFLGETIHARRVGALLVGFAGAMIVMRPTVSIELGMVLVLFSSFGWSIALLVIKVLSRDDSSLTLTLWMGIFMAPLSLLPALAVWTWPEPRDYLLLAVMGATGAVSHLAMAQAFRRADATAVLPVDFTRLLWASLFGFFFWGELPQPATWVGGALIFASTTYIAVREARRGSGPLPEPLPQTTLGPGAGRLETVPVPQERPEPPAR
jgi:drug/metabolite transporter (DMT)-like permease